MKLRTALFISLLVLAGCGNRKTQQTIEESPYGDWEVCDYVDDFGDPTGEKFVRQIIQGDFSNSATVSRPLTVIVFFQERYEPVEGYMRFDEYSDLTEDFHIWSDASPAKSGSKIIDRANHKAYHYRERMGFQEVEDQTWHQWPDILRNTPSTYEFTIKGEYKDEYRFTINSDKLELALKDAGLLDKEEDNKE